MQIKTSHSEFQAFGSVYDQPLVPEDAHMIFCDRKAVPRTKITQLFRFDCEVCLEFHNGIAALIVGNQADSRCLHSFTIHRRIRLHPGVYFAIAAITPEAEFRLLTEPSFSYHTFELNPPYSFNRILSRIQIREILGYYYCIRSAGYHFPGETHNYYELTFVDFGTLHTKIDGTDYIVREKELILYGPGQFHTQTVSGEDGCSYMTVLFDMDSPDEASRQSLERLLLNKKFGYHKKIYQLIKTFVQESNALSPFLNSLLLCLLQEIIIRLLQIEYNDPPNFREAHAGSSISGKNNYQEELLDKILYYINENISEPLTVAEICRLFSLSRSSLQILFKNHLDQTPKKYINDLKLEKSCQLIRENKYTISEIALLLGFNSIHYFSRAFTRKYQVAPSEYAKRLFHPSIGS